MVQFVEYAGRVMAPSDPPIPGKFILNEPTLSWEPLDAGSAPKFAVALHTIQGQIQKSKKKPQMRMNTSMGFLMLEFESNEERDRIISLLTPVFGKYTQRTKKIEPEGPHADIKKELLKNDSDLREVYSALVKEGIISDSEFWKSRQNLVQKQLGTGGVKQQTVGLSSALLAQLQPEKSGKDKTVQLQITPQFMQQVFAEKPHVHRAFVENVPGQMTPVEFWTRFAKHEMQMQIRAKGNKKNMEPPDALFARLAHEPAILGSTKVDPTLNLSMDRHDRKEGESAKDATPHGRGEAIARDMNRHSAVVLQGPSALEKQEKEGPSQSQRFDLADEQSEEIRRKRNRSELEDLRGSAPIQTEKLDIHNPRRYFEKSQQNQEDTGMKEIPSIEEVVRGLELDEGSGLVDSTQAELVLNDIQQDSEQDSSYNWTSSVLPKEMASNLQILLRQKALICNETLRQFWNCIPLRGSASRELKAKKLEEILNKQYSELENFKEAAPGNEKQIVGQFLRPIMESINAALDMFQREMKPVVR